MKKIILWLLIILIFFPIAGLFMLRFFFLGHHPVINQIVFTVWPKKSVNFDEEITLRKGQMVKVKEQDIRLGLVLLRPEYDCTKSIIPECPFYHGNRYIFKVGGYKSSLESPYEYSEIDSDYETFATVVISKKIDRCHRIRDKDCFLDLAVNTGDFALCNEINELKETGRCQYEILAKTDDADKKEMCSFIVDQYWRNQCYWIFRSEYSNLDGCTKIDDLRTRDQCKATFIGTRLLSCEDIELQFVKNKCYFEMAKLNRDSALCRKISEHMDKDMCLSVIAYDISDQSLCDEITFKNEQFDIKSDCLKKFAFPR